MMELTAENVMTTVKDCVYHDDDPELDPVKLMEIRASGDDLTPEQLPPSTIVTYGIMSGFGFNRRRLISHIQDIKDMLSQLPDDFHVTKGNEGWSFLAAALRADGEHWGEHHHIEALVALGGAIGCVRWTLPKPLWFILPGGMPYFTVNVDYVQDWDKYDEETKAKKEAAKAKKAAGAAAEKRSAKG